MELSSLLSSTTSIIPELILVVASLVLIIIAASTAEKGRPYAFFVAIVAIGLSFFANLERFESPEAAFQGALSLDVFSAYFNSIFLFGALFTVLISRDYLKENENFGEYLSLILLCTTGMMFISSAKEFISLFIGFEVMSISVYVLSGFDRRSLGSMESGIKYLVLGGFSSAVLLYGISLLYGATGSVFFEEIIAGFAPGDPLFIAGTVLVLIGFLFKIGAAPFHQWIQDTYEGAPTPVTAFMSVAVKAAAFAILLRFLFEGINVYAVDINTILIAVSILTMTIGNVSAIVQKSIKRMLAYSSIAHAGYLIVGIVARINGEANALSDVLYYIYAYTIMNMGAFAIICCLSRKGRETTDYSAISGLWKRYLQSSGCLAVLMFSLAGIPPTIGFFAKYRVFLAAAEVQLYFLVLVGVINSVVSAYYYLKVLVYAFMHDEQYSFEPASPVSLISIGVLSLAALLFGLFPLYSVEMAIKAAGSL